MKRSLRNLLLWGQVSGAGGALPFSDPYAVDGPLANGWLHNGTWTVAAGKAVNTPTLGAELIVNGGFDSDTVWTKEANWTIGSGAAAKSAGANNSIGQTVLTIGQWYRCVWTLVTYTGGSSFQARFGPSVTSVARAVAATYTDSLRALGTTAFINGGSAAAGTIDNVSAKALTLSTLFATKDFGRAAVDASVEATIVSGNRCGLVLNLDSISSPANFVIADHNGVTARLTKCVAGTYTELISTAATYSAGAPLRVVRTAPTTYQLWYNGTQVGTDQTIADAGIVNNTLHGMFNTYESNGLDDFAIEAE